MKKYRIFVIICTLCLLLGGCKRYKYWYGNQPIDQPGTTWTSADGTVVLEPEENQAVTGYFLIDGQKIDIYWASLPREITIYPKWVLEDNQGKGEEYRYEIWSTQFDHNDHFTVTVEETTFFEVGQQFTIYRID